MELLTLEDRAKVLDGIAMLRKNTRQWSTLHLLASIENQVKRDWMISARQWQVLLDIKKYQIRKPVRRPMSLKSRQAYQPKNPNIRPPQVILRRTGER